jgi:hypothetical protein
VVGMISLAELDLEANHVRLFIYLSQRQANNCSLLSGRVSPSVHACCLTNIYLLQISVVPPDIKHMTALRTLYLSRCVSAFFSR